MMLMFFFFLFVGAPVDEYVSRWIKGGDLFAPIPHHWLEQPCRANHDVADDQDATPTKMQRMKISSELAETWQTVSTSRRNYQTRIFARYRMHIFSALRNIPCLSIRFRKDFTD